MNIDLEAEFPEKRVTKHKYNEGEDDPKELDVIDNDQWDSLDEGSDIERKKRTILKELGKKTRALCKGTIAFNDCQVRKPTPVLG
uniref:Uncharacterized protein n=1 Tax=Lactuca sativa TaxID=4236 RepID=A0A9R1V937_LACSA|nr:hypothetical protein LSAT_V11C600337130 [Lactuca sativa]